MQGPDEVIQEIVEIRLEIDDLGGPQSSNPAVRQLIQTEVLLRESLQFVMTTEKIDHQIRSALTSCCD